MRDDHHGPEATRTVADRSYGGGLVLALVSASSFGLSGSLARSLLDLGWSPAAVVATRVGGAFLVLLRYRHCCCCGESALPTRVAVGADVGVWGGRDRFGATLLFQRGAIPLGRCRPAPGVSGAGLADRLALGRKHRRPAWSVLVAGLSIIGLTFVLDLRDGLTLNPIGVIWGLGAALCLCAYFLLSEDKGLLRHGFTRCC